MEKFVDPERKKHYFFKIFAGNKHETRMRIPKAFYPRISLESQSCERAIVQGPSGEYWVVKVNKNQDGIFLENGWEIFVRENGLQLHDFLVFRYDGSMQFSVMVFNMKGVQREECFAPVRSSPLAEKRIRRGSSSSCPPVGRSRTNLRLRERRFVEQQRPQQQDEDESDEDDSYEEEEDEDESDNDCSEDEVPNRYLDLTSSRKRRSISIGIDKFVSRANKIERRFASWSSSPFFRILIRPSYLKYLPIPRAVARKYFTDDEENVIVKASDASDKRSWEIKIYRVLTPKIETRLTDGIPDFISKGKGMNLKAGDVCIFEILEKRSHQLLLQVHVYRN